MYAVVRRLLFFLPAEAAHRLTLSVLAAAGSHPIIRHWLRMAFMPARSSRLHSQVWGLAFVHPIGLAAGLDKDGEAVAALEALGFAFVEVGTVTPKPQPGNPKPRLFRLPSDRALINRMGFNNHGADVMAKLLAGAHVRPLGINLGKNKDTPLEDAPADYLAAFRTLYDRGDYFVINVSSPNTPGLRSLQSIDALRAIVLPLVAERDGRAQRKSVLVKLSPDLAVEDACAIARECQGWGIDGLIASNTTLGREGLASPRRAEAGGLSGAPLLRRTIDRIRALAAVTALPIVGVGGVFTAEDAYALIRAGASLVQLYTGFIYGGPSTPGQIALGLEALLKRDGYANVKEAVGADIKRGA